MRTGNEHKRKRVKKKDAESQLSHTRPEKHTNYNSITILKFKVNKSAKLATQFRIVAKKVDDEVGLERKLLWQ